MRLEKKINEEAIEMKRVETHMKKEIFEIKCNRCHMDGHNKKTCKLPPPLTQDTSQVSPHNETTSTQPNLHNEATSTQPRALTTQAIL